MTVLDDLSGFGFENLTVDVFRTLGYEDVRRAARPADERQDVLMDEAVDGTLGAVVVECKHTGTVCRPGVRNHHSRVATFGFDGHKREMVATAGRSRTPPRSTPRDFGPPATRTPPNWLTAETSAKPTTRSASISITIGSRPSAMRRFARTIHRKALENTPFVGGVVIVVLAVVVGLFAVL
jgi:hypothetical protein